MITKSDDHAAGVRFVFHESDLFITSMITDPELDDTKSYCQLTIKITISEKRKIAKLCDNGKIYIKKLTKMHKFRSLYTVSMVIETKVVIG